MSGLPEQLLAAMQLKHYTAVADATAACNSQMEQVEKALRQDDRVATRKQIGDDRRQAAVAER